MLQSHRQRLERLGHTAGWAEVVVPEAWAGLTVCISNCPSGCRFCWSQDHSEERWLGRSEGVAAWGGVRAGKGRGGTGHVAGQRSPSSRNLRRPRPATPGGSELLVLCGPRRGVGRRGRPQDPTEAGPGPGYTLGVVRRGWSGGFRGTLHGRPEPLPGWSQWHGCPPPRPSARPAWATTRLAFLVPQNTGRAVSCLHQGRLRPVICFPLECPC